MLKEEQEDIHRENETIQHNLILGYPQCFTDSITKSEINKHPSQTKYLIAEQSFPMSGVYLRNFDALVVATTSGLFLKPNKHALHMTLTATISDRELQQTRQCVYSIPCECGMMLYQ
jgi:DNA polymerase III alpha subunit